MNKSTARTELRNISVNRRRLARTSQLRRLEQTTVSRAPKWTAIDRNTPQGLDLHLIADNYATHKHAKVKA